MKKVIKYLTARIYKPVLVKYLSSTRVYAYKGIRLVIPSEVFHPGFFGSTKLLLRHIGRQPLRGRTFLELGAGSGLISLFAARKGALVTSTDINPRAVEYLKENSSRNHVSLEIFAADLFSDLPVKTFDIIAINPPYYRGRPSDYASYAWYCGENGQYFDGLFSGLANYTHSRTTAWMVLCDGCDMEMIGELARRHGWGLNCVFTKKSLLEKNFIFKIESLAVAGVATHPSF